MGCGPHSLRHCYASTALACGIPVTEVSRWLGTHAMPATIPASTGLAAWPSTSSRASSRGLVMDRDVNAARNLLSLAASGADRVNACGAAVRPGLTAGRAVLKQEPGAADADQTGTAAIVAAAA